MHNSHLLPHKPTHKTSMLKRACTFNIVCAYLSVLFGLCGASIIAQNETLVKFLAQIDLQNYITSINSKRRRHRCAVFQPYSIRFKMFLCRGIGEETQFPKGKGSGLTLRVSCTSLLCKLFVHIRSRLLYSRQVPDGERMVQKP